MYHSNRRLPSTTRWIAGALAVLLPFASHALGLGKLVVRSALHEPLNAEIEFTSITDKELKGLQVGLAPRSDFDAAGVDRLAFLNKIKFVVSKRADGDYFVQLRTDQVIEEPFLHMLLAVEWPGGRMVREYTALIDPPTQMIGKPDAVEAPEASASAEVAPPVESEQLSDGKPWPQLPPDEETVAVVPAMPEEQPQSQPPADAQDGTPPWAAPPIDPKLLEPQTAEPMDSGPTVEPLAPATVAVDSEPVVEPLASSNSSVQSESAPEVSPEPTTASAEKSAVVSSAAVSDDAYKVKRGDTAWRIAEQLRVGNNHTIEQVVLALYRANPNAFFDNNVNNLKAGHILKVPESTQVEATTPIKARTQFRAQYDAWQEYKIKLAGASSAIKVVETAPSTQPAPVIAPTVTVKEPAKQPVKEPAKEPTKTETATTPKDPQSKEELLKIVRSTIQGEKTTPDKKPVEGETQKDTTSKEQAALAGRVATLEESLTSRALENKELGDKVAQVRAQLKRESRLIQIEQPGLAKTQDKLKGSTPAPVVNPPSVIAKVDPTPTPKIETPAPVTTPTVTETPKVVTPAPETPKTVTPAPTPKKRVMPPPAPVEEKGFVSEALDSVLGGDMLMPLIIGLVALLSLGIGVVYFNRRRKSIAEFEESILQSEGIPGNTDSPAVTSDTSGQVVSTGDTSFLSDFSQGGMGNIHTDEVDPIAEAEVYLAYGRDETAEEILKEAMVKNPAREELKLKLLEIYANRSDVRAFETLAEEMYAAMGGRPSKHWPRVSELGRKLNPDNPMFRAGAGASAGASPASFADTARMKTSMPPVTTIMGADAATGQIPTATAPVAGSDFDFDLGDAASAAPAADQGIDFDFANDTSNVKSEPESLDFSKADLDLGSSDSGMETPVSGGGNNVVDFDFGEKEESLTGVPETEIAVADDLSSLDAAPVSDSGEAPQWDETATKLDLARAYIDMGDSEGARSILDEVMAEGNEQQQRQAKELAAQLG